MSQPVMVMHGVIQNMNICYKSCISDHTSGCIEILLELLPRVEGTSNNEYQKTIEDYTNTTKYNLENVIIPHDAIICNLR